MTSNVPNLDPVMGTYGRFPLTLVKGCGTEVFDDQGRRYLDFLAGISVNLLGHAHPALSEALKRQADQLWHVSNLYHIPSQQRSAKLLVDNSGFDQVFFCNSGTEAIEASLKLTRIASLKEHGQERPITIAMKQSFHGRTYGSLSVTGQESYQAPFRPLLPEVQFASFGDLDDLKALMSNRVAAVILEPLQAEGGLNRAPEGYLQGVRELCDANGSFLIFDEVQVGMGRLGHLFAHQGYGVEPDVMALAKGLGGGFPIGAMLAKGRLSQHFVPGTHASTFGGNPLATTVAEAVLKEVLEPSFLPMVRHNSESLKTALLSIAEQFEAVESHRGEGMLQGLKWDRPVAPLVKICLDSGLLVGSAGPQVLRLAPPLNLSEGHLNEGMAILKTSIEKFLA